VAEAVVRLKVDATNANKALSSVQAKTQKLQGAFGGLKTAIAGIGIGLLAKQAVQVSSNFDKLNVRLGLLTKQSGTFAKSQQIAADAQKAFGLSSTEALEGITNITARLAPLGVGVEDIKSTFFGFNTAAKLAGASAIESSNAFRQLAQALGSGRLAGDEFRSISEQIPTLLQPIATELNVPIGKLKELAAEGKLTSDVVLRALRKIETEGAASLKELVANDPTQIFKNFSNATEDLSKAFGKELRPVVEDVTKLLTQFITKLTTFIESDAGRAALLLTAIAASIKAIAVAAPLAGAALAALSIKVGALKIAVLGLSGAIAATGIGAFVIALGALTTQIIKTRREQKELNDAIIKGSGEEVKKALEEQEQVLAKINERLVNANGRTKKNLEEKKKEVEMDIKMLQGRQKTIESDNLINEKLKERTSIQEKNTQEIQNQQTETDKLAEKTEKLKEKMTAVGEEIESSIKNNLRDAITGAKSFGEAMQGVLNKIRDKMLDKVLDNLFGGFGEAFGKGASGGGGGGIGGFIGKIFGGLFANGGQPPVNKISVVGERGPELFVPRSAGTVVPNQEIGGSNITNNISISVDATNSNVQSDEDGQQFGEAIAVAIQSEIIKQKRSGGLLR
jgi:tape measure domain-containing protein